MIIKTNEKIHVRLESFNHELLTASCRKIFNLTQESNLENVRTAAVSLPTNKRIYCVLRSPHVDKDSREHFELKIHKRVIEIYHDSIIDIFNLLSEFELPSGVLCQICLN